LRSASVIKCSDKNPLLRGVPAKAGGVCLLDFHALFWPQSVHDGLYENIVSNLLQKGLLTVFFLRFFSSFGGKRSKTISF